MTEDEIDEMPAGDAYERLTPDERKRAFFLLFGLARFYGEGDTWFATALIPDRPAGMINEDYSYTDMLDRRAPGARARKGLTMVWQALRRAAGRESPLCSKEQEK